MQNSIWGSDERLCQHGLHVGCHQYRSRGLQCTAVLNFGVISVVFLLANCAPVIARQSDENSKFVRYKVAITTGLEIPSRIGNVELVRVFHALPTPREWTGKKSKPGAFGIKWVRKHGKKLYDRKEK